MKSHRQAPGLKVCSALPEPTAQKSGFGRRAFLGGVAAVGASTALARRFARADGAVPKRFIVFYTGNGSVTAHGALREGVGQSKDRWLPAGVGANFDLTSALKAPTEPTVLAPLTPFQDRMLIVAGLSNEVAKADPINGTGPDGRRSAKGHHAMGSMLSGAYLHGWPDRGAPKHAWSGGATVDQTIAAHISADTALRSLELGVQPTAGDGNHLHTVTAYAGADEPLFPEADPFRAAERLFAGVVAGGEPDEEAEARLARIRAERASVFDVVGDQLQAVSARLGQHDRHRFERHLASMRTLEQRLTVGARGMPNALCAPPALEPGVSRFPEVGQLQMDVLVAAMACDLTRVGSLQWSNAGGETMQPEWLGVPDMQLHELTHGWQGETKFAHRVAVERWHAEQLAYLCGRLEAIEEADGSTMLDNTVILWTNNMADGGAHNMDGLPYVLMGGRCLGLRQGELVNYYDSGFSRPSTSHTRLLVSLCQLYGLDLESFGEPEHCTDGPLTDIFS